MPQGAREDILERLRAAERSFAGHNGAAEGAPPTFSEAELFSDYAPAGADLLEQFCGQFEKLRGTARVVSNSAEAAGVLVDLAGRFGVEDDGTGRFTDDTVLMQDTGLIRSVWDALPEGEKPRFRLVDSAALRPEMTPNTEFARAGTGVSGCDLLVARSGSIALRTTVAGGRRLSVVPGHHIVIARASQISAGLAPWYEIIKNDPLWSYGVLISGPSRTSDIEKILVLGAHGPKRLSAIIIR